MMYNHGKTNSKGSNSTKDLFNQLTRSFFYFLDSFIYKKQHELCNYRKSKQASSRMALNTFYEEVYSGNWSGGQGSWAKGQHKGSKCGGPGQRERVGVSLLTRDKPLTRQLDLSRGIYHRVDIGGKTTLSLYSIAPLFIVQ